MKALITGIGGFVGPYLAENLLSRKYSVFGIDRNESKVKGCKCFACDITDERAVEDVISEVRPDVIFHLAGQSSVEKSYKEPELTFRINVDGTNNIFAALINCNLRPKVLIVSSSDVYGAPDAVPIDEHSSRRCEDFGVDKEGPLVLDIAQAGAAQHLNGISKR